MVYLFLIVIMRVNKKMVKLLTKQIGSIEGRGRAQEQRPDEIHRQAVKHRGDNCGCYYSNAETVIILLMVYGVMLLLFATQMRLLNSKQKKEENNNVLNILTVLFP